MSVHPIIAAYEATRAERERELNAEVREMHTYRYSSIGRERFAAAMQRLGRSAPVEVPDISKAVNPLPQWLENISATTQQ